ncbi:MAG: hypothetical protein HRF52_05885 [Ignavibacterium sp.]|uniref:hypothetical protein n=1 Tax=Ignavibacterium sp. TaxID=2651167 RepID=UPI0032978FC5
MRTCTICGREIKRRDLCSRCFKEWGNKGNYPAWLEELVHIQSSFERSYANKEITFTDMSLDIYGEDKHEE